MREIKFRAWDGKKYLYNIIPIFSTKKIISFAYDEELHNVECFEQFLGHDKEHHIIYEGDIVKIKNQITKIFIFESCPMVILRKKNEFVGHFLRFNECEFVARGFENPELLSDDLRRYFKEMEEREI